MKYVVISGDYKTVLDRGTPGEAAHDAIGLWKYKQKKPKLAKLTTIVDPKKQELYMSTIELLNYA